MSIKKTKNADIQYGKIDLLKDSDFEPRNIGHRISIVIPEDVLMAFREQASKLNTRYQTLINKVLRNHLHLEVDLEERIEMLEKAVFKGKK